MFSLGYSPQPMFDRVYAMATHERYMAQCHKSQTGDHDSGVCGANQIAYGRCRNCRTYTVHDVYPELYKVLGHLLRESSITEDVKHGYRVQLAAGLLSASWTQRPPRSLQSVADSLKPGQ